MSRKSHFPRNENMFVVDGIIVPDLALDRCILGSPAMSSISAFIWLSKKPAFFKNFFRRLGLWLYIENYFFSVKSEISSLEPPGCSETLSGRDRPLLKSNLSIYAKDGRPKANTEATEANDLWIIPYPKHTKEFIERILFHKLHQSLIPEDI